MSWAVAIYSVLLPLGVTSFLLLAIGSAAVLATRQPARRIRIIELTLAGLLFLPGFLLIPGYPRWAVLPALENGPLSNVTSHTRSIVPFAQNPGEQQGPNAKQLETPVTSENESPQARLSTTDSPNKLKSSSADTSDHALLPILPDRRQPTVSWEGGLNESASDFRAWVAGAYLAGLTVMIGWSLVGVLAVKRLLRSSRPADAACHELLRAIGGDNIDRVALVVSSKAAQPCAFAWRPTTIVLPLGLCQEQDSQKLRWALAHEWSHVVHGDVWSWLGSGLLRWFYFYQPLLWWLRRRLSQDFVADACAAGRGESREDYAEFLAKASINLPGATLAAGLGIGGRGSDLKRRVVMLVEDRHPLETSSPRRWNLAAIPLAVLILSGIASLRQQPPVAAAAGNQALQAVSDSETTATEKASVTKPADPLALPGKSELLKPLDTVQVLVSLSPNRIVNGVLQADPPELKISGAYLVEPDGDIAFPHGYGRVHVEGLDPKQAGVAIRKQLSEKIKIKTALPPVHVVRRGHAVWPEGKEPRPGYRVRIGDSLTIGEQDPNAAFDYVVTAEGTVPAVSYASPFKADKVDVKVAGLTLAEAHEAVQKVSMRANLGQGMGGIGGLTKGENKMMPYPILLTLGGWKEEADPEVIEPFEGTDQNRAQRLERELLEMKDMIRELKSAAPKSASAKRSATAPASAARPTGPTVSPYLNLLHDDLETQTAGELTNDARVFSEKIARHPELLGVRGQRSSKSTGVTAPAADPKPDHADPAQQTPSRIKLGDLLNIEVEGTPPESPMRNQVVVESTGQIALGVRYGRVHVQGKTLEEAERAISEHLSEILKAPQVQLTFADEWQRNSDEKVVDLKRQVEELQKLVTQMQTAPPTRAPVLTPAPSNKAPTRR